MDNNNTAGGLAIDPNQLAPQNLSPQMPISNSTASNHLVDITPGAQNISPVTPSSSHIDEAVLPDNKVIDITPNSLSDFDKIPPTPTATEAIIDITPTATPTPLATPIAPSSPSPVVIEQTESEPAISTPPMGTLPPLPVAPSENSAPLVPSQTIAPEAAEPQTTLVPPASSPIAEDPNLVNTIG
jgi:hypothetical protein